MDRVAVHDSWPLWDQSRHFELGHILSCAVTDVLHPAKIGMLGVHHAGLWECDLADNSLIWSGGVYDIFGLERGAAITRDMAVAHYSEDSRAKMEALRTHAIRHKCGFTLDTEIRAACVGEARRMRLIAAPIREGGVVVRLHGVKLIV